MRIARYFVGVCFIVSALFACAGGPGQVLEDPLGQGKSSSSENGGQSGQQGEDKKTSSPPTETNPGHATASDGGTNG